MNLQCYDNAVKETNSRIWVPAKCLYTKVVPFKKYYILLKRYNKEDDINEFFIWLTDDENIDPQYNKQLTNRTNRGTVYIHLNSIWNDLQITNYLENVFVKLELEEEDDNDCIYRLIV